MISENVLRKYAKLAVVMGVNVQKGQPLVISSDVTSIEENAFFHARKRLKKIIIYGK